MAATFARIHCAYQELVDRERLVMDSRDMVEYVFHRAAFDLTRDWAVLLDRHRAHLDEYVAVSRGKIEPGCAWY